MKKIVLSLLFITSMIMPSQAGETSRIELVRSLLQNKTMSTKAFSDSLSVHKFFNREKLLTSAEYAIIDQEIRNRFQNLTTYDDIFWLYGIQSTAYGQTGEIGKLILLTTNNLNQAQSRRDTAVIIFCLYSYFQNYSSAGMPERALEYASKCYNLKVQFAKTELDRIDAAGQYAWPLATLGYQMGNNTHLDSSLVLLKRVLEYAINQDNSKTLSADEKQKIFLTVSPGDKFKIYQMTLMRRQKYNEIIESTKDLLSKPQSHKWVFNFFDIYSKTGLAYAYLNKRDSAFFYLDKDEIFFDETNDYRVYYPKKKKYIEFYQFRERVKAFLLFKDYKAAAELCDLGVYAEGRFKGKNFYRSTVDMAANVYLEAGQLNKALDCFKMAKQFADSSAKEGDQILNEALETSTKIQIDATEEAANLVLANAMMQSNKELEQKNLILICSGLGILMSLIFFVVLYQRFKTIKIQQRVIEEEKKRSDELLLNILPPEVSEELKAKGSADAKLIDEVTALFTDFKGFTILAEKLSPKELVKEINECFSAFDNIMHKHGVEKIKTIGDAYMAAGGLPTPNKTHAEDVVNAAIEIQDFMHRHKAEREAEGKLFFEIRIGIHTGPVVAGIVGIRKFAYDIWGDTVNTASHMESSGEVGKINISGSTYELVKDKFTCTHRGKIRAKGKGEIDMFFVDKKV